VAFETIRGASGVDFVGTAGVDALFSLNETGSITAEGLAGDDTINVANSTGVVGTTTVKGGEGKDTITFTDAAGADVSRLLNSSVNGGAGDDSISTEGAESSVIRGNEDDDNFNIAGNYSNTTINGNVGEDSFSVTAAVTLSNSKILGGDSADGLMNFSGTGGIAAAINSTINGSKGNDFITIGDVDSANGFTIFGGQGNDVISIAANSTTADGMVYSGDKGDDQITTAGKKDSVLGGEGEDLLNAGAGNDTIDAGIGDDIVTDAAGDDTTTLGEGNDTYTDAAGDDVITGGAGADSYTVNNTAGDKNSYVISTVSDSAATLTGKVADQGFDTFDAAFSAATSTIDISAMAESLLGDAVGSTTTVNAVQATVVTADGTLNVVQSSGLKITAAGAAAGIGTAGDTLTGVAVFEANSGIKRYYAGTDGDLIATVKANGDLKDATTLVFTDADAAFPATAAGATAFEALVTDIKTSAIYAAAATTFAELRTELGDGTKLTASGSDTISVNTVTMQGDTYVIVNNTNNILDSGDLMFEVGDTAASINQFGLYDSTATSSAWDI
jgi:Ca2+-binding RTX toxin-like protein